MKDLLAGYRRFRTADGPERQSFFKTLAQEKQNPKALIISCIDSRIDPAMIFDTSPGQILVVRNVANLVPPYEPDSAYHGTSAALEFGARVLEIPHIIVLGHEHCGGVEALLNGAPDNARDFVAPWMSMAGDARRRALEKPLPERSLCCEHEVVKVSLANLMTFPWIADGVRAGRTHLHGAWFSIENYTLSLMGPDGAFSPVPLT